MSDAPALAPVELTTASWLNQMNGDPWGDLMRAAAWCQQEFAIIIGKTAYQRLVQHLDTADRFRQWFGSLRQPDPHLVTDEDLTRLPHILMSQGRQCILALVGILTGARAVTVAWDAESAPDKVLFVPSEGDEVVSAAMAYTSYAVCMGWVGTDGTRMQRWEGLSDPEQNAWRVGMQDVREKLERHKQAHASASDDSHSS
mgnify:CR=1